MYSPSLSSSAALLALLAVSTLAPAAHGRPLNFANPNLPNEILNKPFTNFAPSSVFQAAPGQPQAVFFRRELPELLLELAARSVAVADGGADDESGASIFSSIFSGAANLLSNFLRDTGSDMQRRDVNLLAELLARDITEATLMARSLNDLD
ncbi:hypothetical protein BDW22DRAFT_37395 [Trametopsis cervina]|nr:hypothetical protein BDW22DRAFT_37395 [Trametopsis cervina]